MDRPVDDRALSMRITGSCTIIICDNMVRDESEINMGGMCTYIYDNILSSTANRSTGLNTQINMDDVHFTCEPRLAGISRPVTFATMIRYEPKQGFATR